MTQSETKTVKPLDFIKSTAEALKLRLDRATQVIDSDQADLCDQTRYDTLLTCYLMLINSLAAEEQLQRVQNLKEEL